MSVPVAKLIEQSAEGWLRSWKEEASSALGLVALCDSQGFFWLTMLNSQFVFQGMHWDYPALTICSASKNPNFSMDPKSRLGRGGKLLVHTMLAELSDDTQSASTANT